VTTPSEGIGKNWNTRNSVSRQRLHAWNWKIHLPKSVKRAVKSENNPKGSPSRKKPIIETKTGEE
jgi:hypothetical protein